MSYKVFNFETHCFCFRLAKHINVPRVVDLRKHILVMSFIGEDRKAAPKLRDAGLSLVECEIAWDQVQDVSGGNNNGSSNYY